MTNSERFVLWVAGLLDVKVALTNEIEAQLASLMEQQFNNARMMTRSAMPNRETQAWWGGVTYACASVYEKLGEDVPLDITTMVAKLSRIFTG